MNKEIILTEFSETFEALAKAVKDFDVSNFNEVPFENSWTPAQVVQHLVLANDGFATVLDGNIEETSRPVDKLIPTLRDIFLNFGTKMKSPDFIEPKHEIYNREELLKALERISRDTQAAIEKLDLTKTCIDFELPTIGFLTRLEAVYFVIYHTQRHTHQLVEIKKKLLKND